MSPGFDADFVVTAPDVLHQRVTAHDHLRRAINGGFPDVSIGRITTSGAVSSDTDPSISNPFGITTGPDGAL